MGVDKARLVIGTEALAVRTGRVLANVCDPVVEVGHGASALSAIRESPVGSGPLVAFLAGVEHLQPADAVLLLACDLPAIDEVSLQWIVEQPGSATVIPTIAGTPQYACARYSRVAIDAARHAVAHGRRALSSLADAGDVTYLAADEHAEALADVDTPADLHRLDG
jgi:molybdopterin-guanine dinucleotide biosynthesis protein A